MKSYDDNARGKIINKSAKRQIMDFSGLRYGNITPTDLDGYFEMQGEIFVFYEFKRPGNDMPYGQKLALTRLIDVIGRANESGVLILCEYQPTDADDEIDAGNSVVKEYYTTERQGKWFNGKNRTAREVTDSFIEFANSKKRNSAAS